MPLYSLNIIYHNTTYILVLYNIYIGISYYISIPIMDCIPNTLMLLSSPIIVITIEENFKYIIYIKEVVIINEFLTGKCIMYVYYKAQIRIKIRISSFLYLMHVFLY